MKSIKISQESRFEHSHASIPSQGVLSRMKSTAKKISAILWLTMTGSAFAGTPVREKPLQNTWTRLYVSEKQPPRVETVNVWPKNRLSTARKGESVEGFMLRSFGTKTGWQFLVDNVSGHRVRIANRDLIAGRTYILAKNEQEASMLAALYKNDARERKMVEKSEKNMETTKKWKSKGKVVTPKVKKSLPVDFLQTIEKLGFDMDRYFHSIASEESRHRYSASNAEKWRTKRVDSSKWALGKYQFTHKTLEAFGISTEAEREAYLRSPKQQEHLMRLLTLGNIRHLVSNPVFEPLLDSGMKPHELLSAMHHMWPGGAIRVAKKILGSDNPVSAFFLELETSRDWLKTSTWAYVRSISANYDRYEATAPVSKKAKRQTIEKLVPVAKKAPASSLPEINPADEKITAPATGKLPEIDPNTLKPAKVSTSSNVLPFIPAAQVNAILESVRADDDVNREVREGLVAKLQEVKNLVTLYEDNIEYHELQAYMGSASSRDMLPGLRALLHKAKSEQSDLRSSLEESIMHYEIEARNGSAYAKQILPKLYELVSDDDSSLGSELAA